MRRLVGILTGPERLSYNEEGKNRFERIGRRAMKDLALELGLKEYEVTFNPGGIAVSRDLRLMGLWEPGSGLYVLLNQDFAGAAWGEVLYRSITHLRDYRGGPNGWFPFGDLLNESGLNRLLAVDPQDVRRMRKAPLQGGIFHE